MKKMSTTLDYCEVAFSSTIVFQSINGCAAQVVEHKFGHQLSKFTNKNVESVCQVYAVE